MSAQDALTRRDGQGAVTVVVTLAGLPDGGVPIRAPVVLDTHTVALDDVVFERAVALRMPEGAEVAPRWSFRRSRSGGQCASTLPLLPHEDALADATDEKKAAATASYQGQTYYFCSAGCKVTFEKGPAQYATADDERCLS